jgi:hypothetical protein
LADDQVIHPETAQIFANYFSGGEGADIATFHLHKHQSDAIRSVCGEGKNLVVCSGTGSGKTEAFLIPLVNHLVGEWIAAGRPENWNAPGVRALILYPMNALVNDQVRRLRGVLRYAPYITFGKYIGETKEDDSLRADLMDNFVAHEQAVNGVSDLDNYHGNGFDNETRLPNEIATRTRWATNPGHILVSNYSMLERLLVIPNQNNLFGNAWKFIILDEAHSYSGALGTEIAWLIRRLKRRVEDGGSEGGNIRYLATSATLIHSQETEEIKAQRIRDEFASKLFPAAAATFAVQFGHVQEPPAHEAATEATAENYRHLIPDGDRLLSETRDLLGRKKIVQDLAETLQLVPQAGQGLAAGDAIHLLEQACHVVGSGALEVDAPDALHTDVLSPDSAAAVILLRNLVVAGVSGFNDWDAWREWLHDPTDTRRSSIPGDDDNGQRNRIGNRLHLRDEWQAVNQAACVLSREGFEYLVRTASELSITADMDADPLAVQMQLSEGARGYLENLRDVVQKALALCEQDIGAMANQWRERFANNGFQASPGDTTIQQVFFRALNADSKPMALIQHLTQAIREFTPENQERMKLQATAAWLFPNAGADNAADAICNLINLGTLAVAPGSRTPLVDIRYHQLVRGIGEIRINLVPNGQNADFTLSKGFHAPGLGFGCCRECGQPYVLAYASARQFAGQAESNLTPYKGSTNQFLHAFAWSPGNELDDQEDNPMAPDASQWLDTADGRWQSGQANPGNSWVPVHWHVEAANDDSPEFLAECPCCRSKQRRDNNTRFGIITPYEMAGTQLKLVAMEELERHADPSGDPVARANPGEGRKLLVFSDSRSAAAQLAWRFQDFFGQMTIPRLIRTALTAFAANPWDQELKQRLIDALVDENPNFQGNRLRAEEALHQDYGPQRPSPELPIAAIPLASEVEKENLGGLLAVASQNGVDLAEREAARFQLLRALRKNNRHGLLRHGILRVHPKNKDAWTAGNLGLPSGADIQPIMEWVMVFLIERVTLAELGELPSDELNRFKKYVYRDNNPAPANAQEGTLFVSNHRNSNANRFMRRALLEHPAIWEVGCRQALRNLPGANAPLGAAVAGLPLEILSELAKLAESGTQSEFRTRIAQLFQQPFNLGVRDKVQGCMSKHLVEVAGNLLEQIWLLLTNDQMGRAPLRRENSLWSLNWMNLIILPGENCDPCYPDWSMEDRNINGREIIPCRVEEHTAQISSARGSAYQQAFANGRINILSCSTTFEMGVDLGDLGCVFLNGLPPSMANYRQRAGRAGRRPGSSSYVLTFVGDHPHDLYFWDRPAELLFGSMDAPKIYLDNPIYRARHLRAEALHSFLAWMEQNNHLLAAATDPQNNNQPIAPFRRRWKFVGDFFLGVTAGKRIRGNNPHAGNFPLTRRFAPIANEIANWMQAEGRQLGQYLETISDIGQIDYCVASDLLWQVASQAAGNLVPPFPLNHAENHARFHLLGGPNIPKIEGNILGLEPETQPKRREVNVLARSHYAMGNDPEQFTHIEAVQNHVLKEQVIDWLAKNRVLPRYGFPVDVIRLLPDNFDSYGRDIELERDLKIGLYEYAPGQSVVADKRIYKTADGANPGVKVFRQGQLAGARADDAWKRWFCNACQEVFINIPRDQNPAPPCPLCSQNAMVLRQFVVPDAFQADRSQSFAGVRPERPAPMHLLTGGAREPWRCAGISMDCAESEAGTITYLNMGPKNQGFGAPQAFSLLHEVRTDIALWRAHQNALGVFQGQRRESALRSTLQAILRAAARVKNIEDRDLAGLVHHFNRNEAAFVLFDDSSGGGGACLDLVLTGDLGRDNSRKQTIRQILEVALDICDCPNCSAAFPNADANLMPLPLDDFRALLPANRARHREQQSCYHCLRSYRNQRDHKHLDRLDAMRILEVILAAPVDAGANPPVPQPPPVRANPPPVAPIMDLPPGDNFILPACPGRVGGPFNFARVAENAALAPATYLVRLENGEHVLGRVNTNLIPLMLSYQGNGDHHEAVQRQQIIAKLL